MSRDLARGWAQELAAAGVTRIFGVPGGGPNLDMIGAAAEHGIAFTLAHCETAACIMAGTYGRLTGTLGVAVVTRGPGFTSAYNGLAQATLDRYPLMLVSDTVSQAAAPRVGHQRLDQVGAAAAIAKWSGTLGSHEPAALVRAAIDTARSAPAGGVHVAFDATATGTVPPASDLAMTTSPDDIVRVHELIASARKPLFIIGEDAVHHLDDVRRTIAGVRAPIMSTYQALGVVPADWPSNAGLYTGVKADSPLLDEADVIIGIGLDSTEPMPGGWSWPAPVVIFHSVQADVGYFGDAQLVVGEYAQILPQDLASSETDWPVTAGATWWSGRIAALLTDDPSLTPQNLVLAVRKHAPDAHVTVDAGAHMLAVMPLWPADEPNHVLISNGLATMGFALPAAIGTAYAYPGERVVAFTGDGGLGMVLAELEVVARGNLPITIVVFNDATLTLIKLKQEANQGGPDAVDYAQVDFAGIANAMGVTSVTTTTVAEVTIALESAGDGPLLIDARIDPDQYTHIMKAVRG
jgi:acetolactate synthase I/II/III large subunit